MAKAIISVLSKFPKETETIFKHERQYDYYVFAEEINSSFFPYYIERIDITDNSIEFVHVESQTKKKMLVFQADYLLSKNTPNGTYTFKHFTAKDLDGKTVFETDTTLTEEEIKRFGMNTDWYLVLDGIRLYQVNSTTEKKTLFMYYKVEDDKLLSIYDEDENNIYFSIKITTFKNEKFVYSIKFGKN